MFSILVIDDEPNNFEVIEAFLANEKYKLNYVNDAQKAIASLEVFNPDLILLDVMKPNMDGLQACQIIKKTSRGKNIPIIMVTALSGQKNLAECLDSGADDFIAKPINRLELKARVNSMLRIRQQYQQLKKFNHHLEEIINQKILEIERIKTEDNLTKLPSRFFLIKKLEQILTKNHPNFAIFHLDCNQFKLVNGSFGHHIGNQLLVEIATRLKKITITSGSLSLYRIGGDEFCFLLENIDQRKTLQSLISKIKDCFSQPFIISQIEIFVTVSIGITIYNDKYQYAEQILQDADTAMYKAKLKGKNTHQVFDSEMHKEMLNRLTLETDLQKGLKLGEFINYYQPIFNLTTNQLSGVEALIRWQHDKKGVISPSEFIPVMETSGLILEVGMLVFRQACQQLHQWQQQGFKDLFMSVNLSPRQFSSETLLTDIDQIIAETGVNPQCLKLEITESALMDNPKSSLKIVEEIRNRQISISIDDFGTGYSSLSYLHYFPLDSLKIDHSFIASLTEENNQTHIVTTIIKLAQQLNLSVIAEGIETKEQVKYLQQLGCEFGQGYYYSKPLRVEEIENVYQKGFRL